MAPAIASPQATSFTIYCNYCNRYHTNSPNNNKQISFTCIIHELLTKQIIVAIILKIIWAMVYFPISGFLLHLESSKLNLINIKIPKLEIMYPVISISSLQEGINRNAIVSVTISNVKSGIPWTFPGGFGSVSSSFLVSFSFVKLLISFNVVPCKFNFSCVAISTRVKVPAQRYSRHYSGRIIVMSLERLKDNYML